MGGMKKILEKLQEKAAGKKQKPADPKSTKEAKKEEVRRMTERTLKAINLAKKGVAQYNEVSKKVEGVAEDAAQKAIDVAETVKPLAEKVDNATSSLRKKAKSFLKGALEKKQQVEKDNAAKPTTGSGILDLLTPAVPKTDATKPKAGKDQPPKPPQP